MLGFDRRQNDQSLNCEKPASLPEGVEEKRQTQRRAYFRVVYPTAAQPVILDTHAKVIDISVRALRFQIPNEEAKQMNLDINSTINAKLKFHDGQMLEIDGRISRKLEDKAGNFVFVCMFAQEIHSDIINKEQAYLLHNFPDFCRQVFKFVMPPE
jgi:hypothetical protein